MSRDLERSGMWPPGDLERPCDRGWLACKDDMGERREACAIEVDK